MAVITLRIPKGAPLTNQEADGNFSNINTELGIVNSNVGAVTSLTTNVKSNLVHALNEVLTRATSNVTITGGNIIGVSNVASLSNVYATNYFIGNGSLLTGIVVDSTRLVNGNTDLSIVSATGNFVANIAGNIAFTISSLGSQTNVYINGNVTSTAVKTGALQDSLGRTLRILDESNAIIWGG